MQPVKVIHLIKRVEQIDRALAAHHAIGDRVGVALEIDANDGSFRLLLPGGDEIPSAQHAGAYQWFYVFVSSDASPSLFVSING